MSSELADVPLISVIVPTRNNARTIEACLRSVQAQSYPAIELITVDNGSTDGSDSICRQYADVFRTAGPERSAQRNLGIELARGEWVLWLDSDMVLPPESLQIAMQTAIEAAAVGVGLPERTIGEGFWTACRALERQCYLDDIRLHNPRLLRRDYIIARGGFDTRMSGPEDTDLGFQMRAEGQRIALAPIIVDHDEGRLSLPAVLRKRYYYGLSLPVLSSTREGAVSKHGRAVVSAYARHWRSFAADPAHGAGMVLMRGLEASAYLVGAVRGRRRGHRDG